MKQLFTFIRKEYYHVTRDRKTLIMLFGLPIMLILLFGFALTNEIKNAQIVICDYAQDQTSQEIINKIKASKSFKVEKVILNEDQIYTAFKKGKIKMAVVFPENLNSDLVHLNKAQIQVIADASDPNNAAILTTYITSIIADYQASLLQNTSLPLQIIPEVRMLYNPELKGATDFVPGIMALVLVLICVLMTSVSLVKEKEMGTMELLLVTPMNPFLMIIAKAVPYFFISLVNLVFILLLSVYLLDLPFNGSLLLFFAESSVLIITALSLGLLVSSITSSQQTAMLISLLGMMLPTMIFTGFLFPIENMPWPLRVVSNIVPSKWYYIIVKDVMIKGLGFTFIWKETLILFCETNIPQQIIVAFDICRAHRSTAHSSTGCKF
jgi:ABC-2 type transport system permease protein